MSSTGTATFTRPSLPPLPPDQGALLTISPIPVPAFPDPSSMSFAVLSRISIAAPPAVVSSAILDVKNWGKWNSFVPFAEVHPPSAAVPEVPLPVGLGVGDNWLRLGSKMTERVNMDGKRMVDIGPVGSLRASPVRVTVVEAIDVEKEGRKGYRICWRYDAGNEWFLRSERVQEVVETEGGCEYVNWETFGGWMAPVVRLAVGRKLTERFGDWGKDLKDFCETKKGEELDS